MGTISDDKFIREYDFGTININGNVYENDVILLGKKVVPNWWRDKGHELKAEDLEQVKDFNPDLLIIGQGYYGRMSVPNDLKNELDVDFESHKTKEAIEIYNDKVTSGKKIAGAFHLTC